MEQIGRVRTISTGSIALHASPAPHRPASAHLIAYDGTGEMTSQTYCLATESALLDGLHQLGVPEDQARTLAAEFAVPWEPGATSRVGKVWSQGKAPLFLSLVLIPWLVGAWKLAHRRMRK